MDKMNWDDLKFFLAVCNHGSIRAAANALGVNHATVSRRINNFEASLGERLFERSAKGYSQTALAKELFLDASLLEERMNSVQRRIVSQDETLEGNIRVTFPENFGDAVMDDIADFCQLYPKVNLEIVATDQALNLLNRETDVAIRICERPPNYVIGRKLLTIHRAAYIARKLLPKLKEPGWLKRQTLLGWSDKIRNSQGLFEDTYPPLESSHKIRDMSLNASACIHGMGIAVLPCAYADRVTELVRIPPYTSEAKYDLWLLSHPDMRTNQKINTFVRFITARLLAKRALFEGEEFKFPDLSLSE